MSLFSKILEKLGLKKDKPAGVSGGISAAPKPATPAKPGATAVRPAPRPSVSSRPVAPSREEALQKISASAPAPVAAPAPISEVDVVKKLEGLAAANPLKLNWKTSIADLLFLLGLENNLKARKELATELGCPAEFMKDSAKMNTWLHKEVLRQIAQNGGNIPKELLD